MLCQELPAVWYHRSRGQFRKHPVRWLSIYCRRLPVCVVHAPHPWPLACELKLRHLGGARSGKLGCRSQEPALTAGGKLWGECVLVCVGGEVGGVQKERGGKRNEGWWKDQRDRAKTQTKDAACNGSRYHNCFISAGSYWKTLTFLKLNQLSHRQLIFGFSFLLPAMLL